MNQRIGVNFDKIMGNYSRRIKIPAITQRKYEQSFSDYDDYLDDEEFNSYEPEEIYEGCPLKSYGKTIAALGLGVVVGVVGGYLLSKSSRRW